MVAYPGLWPGLWLSLLAVAAYLGSLQLSQRWHRRLAPVVLLSLLLLLSLLAMRLSQGLDMAVGTSSAHRLAPVGFAGDLWQMFHLLLWVLATAAIWLAAMQAALLLRQRRRIKQGGQPAEERLPLDDMDRILTALASASLVLVTLALLYSYWWYGAGANPISASKYYLSAGIWLLAAAVPASRWLFGWRGYRLAGWFFAVLGVLVMVFAWGFSFG